jgi:ABC-type uncharacterized transport system auxiliary subunit
VRLPVRMIEAGFVADERARAVSGDLPSIAQAFDDALGTVMRKVVEWTLRTGQPRRRR